MQRKVFRIEKTIRERRAASPPVEAAAELGAAAETMEQAAQRILESTEAIDDAVRRLASGSLSPDGRRLARDIQDGLARIYEACHFQDSAGQRIGKVIGALAAIERDRDTTGADARPLVVAALPCSQFVNGPRLDGASGHISQSEIDALFD